MRTGASPWAGGGPVRGGGAGERSPARERRSGSAGRSAVQARAILSAGRLISSLTSATRTGVIAAAIQVPAIQSCETAAAAEADAALAITSVRMLWRRSSSRSAARGRSHRLSTLASAQQLRGGTDQVRRSSPSKKVTRV